MPVARPDAARHSATLSIPLLLGVILHKLDLVQSIVYSGGSLIILVYLYSCELIWPQGIHDAMYAGEYTIRGHFFGELLQKMFVF